MGFTLTSYSKKSIVTVWHANSSSSAMVRNWQGLGGEQVRLGHRLTSICGQVMRCAKFPRRVLPQRQPTLLLSSHQGGNTLLEDQRGDHR